MAVEIELNPVGFITIGTIGPKGKRVFHLQAGKGTKIVSLIIEKEQAWALSEAINELVDDLDRRYPVPEDDSSASENEPLDMDLREPIEPLFRVAQMGLGYDEEQDKVVLLAQELMISQDEDTKPGVIRFWCSRQQMRALSEQAMLAVKAGRADPKQNGRLVYYWT
ncbi:MAG: DUF3090 domain-containing protein [Chloroflexi bacterium]|nr:MAG: DUF3090 domain-containing protein [Chloroflexota bacterium]